MMLLLMVQHSSFHSRLLANIETRFNLDDPYSLSLDQRQWELKGKLDRMRLPLVLRSCTNLGVPDAISEVLSLRRFSR